MISRIAVAALALSVSVTASADAQQRRMDATSGRQAEGALFIGGSRLDLDDLNSRLTAHGYPEFGGDFPQVGGLLGVTRQKLHLGLEFASGARPSEVRDDGRYRSTVRAGYGMFNVGYDAVAEGGFTLRPRVGVGAGALNLSIEDRQPASFDEVLIAPGRSVNLTGGSLLLDASVGATYRVRTGTTARGARSLFVGVRGGYTTSVLHGGWREVHADVSGGPEAGWGGPHLEVMIGRSTSR